MWHRAVDSLDRSSIASNGEERRRIRGRLVRTGQPDAGSGESRVAVVRWGIQRRTSKWGEDVSEKTGISWTDHTFNPWWGCVKVSPACTNCYAERDSKRYGFKVWGQDADRRFFGDDHWKEPLRWNQKAKAEGVRRRVFCASMSDWAEMPNDAALLARLDQERMRLCRLIEATPFIDWLLLTKRADFIMRCVPRWWSGGWPANAWAGATAETQGWLEERLVELLGVPAPVRFLSIEPMLGGMNLRRVRHKYELGEVYVDALTGRYEGDIAHAHVPSKPRGLQWVIAGGESGPGARPSHLDWMRSLRDQCQAAGVPFHFKQWGEWAPYREDWALDKERSGVFTDGKFVEDGSTSTWDAEVTRYGKKRAGRELDGREWNEFPKGIA